MNFKRFNLYDAFRELAKRDNIKLFWDVDGGFCHDMKPVDFTKTNGNFCFQIRQRVSLGEENTYFDFILYDFLNETEIDCGGCYFKNYKPNIITPEIATYLVRFSGYGEDIDTCGDSSSLSLSPSIEFIGVS